jgi:hypothetical protein
MQDNNRVEWSDRMQGKKKRREIAQPWRINER